MELHYPSIFLDSVPCSSSLQKPVESCGWGLVWITHIFAISVVHQEALPVWHLGCGVIIVEMRHTAQAVTVIAQRYTIICVERLDDGKGLLWRIENSIAMWIERFTTTCISSIKILAAVGIWYRIVFLRCRSLANVPMEKGRAITTARAVPLLQRRSIQHLWQHCQTGWWALAWQIRASCCLRFLLNIISPALVCSSVN